MQQDKEKTPLLAHGEDLHVQDEDLRFVVKSAARYMPDMVSNMIPYSVSYFLPYLVPYC